MKLDTANQMEKIAYHALTLALQGDYEKIRSARSSRENWQATFLKVKPRGWPEAENAWQELARKNILLCFPGEAAFPKLLEKIPWPLNAFYFIGEAPGNEPKIAIVGTRKATAAGLETARRFARELGEAGLTIVSGLALGIDAAAHTGALEAKAKTIAVIAGGLDSIYPKQNESLARKIIASGGTIISEYPPGTPTLPRFFIERNRIVSGLSRGVVIVEAPKKSGALATARFAAEQDRELFVIPGGVSHPNYEGAHALIKSGAALVTDTNDILAGLGFDAREVKIKSNRAKFDKLEETQKIVLQCITSAAEPINRDTIAKATKLSSMIVNQILAELTIDNLVQEENGRYSIQ